MDIKVHVDVERQLWKDVQIHCIQQEVSIRSFVEEALLYKLNSGTIEQPFVRVSVSNTPPEPPQLKTGELTKEELLAAEARRKEKAAAVQRPKEPEPISEVVDKPKFNPYKLGATATHFKKE